MYFLFFLGFMTFFAKEEDRYGEIVKLRKESSYSKLVEKGEKFLKDYPTSSNVEEVRMCLGLSYGREGKDMEANLHFSQVTVSKLKADTECFALNLRTLFNLEMYEEVVNLEKSIEECSNMEYKNILAWSLYHLGQFKRSGEIFSSIYKEREDEESIYGAISSYHKLKSDRLIGYFREYEIKFEDSKEHLEEIYSMAIEHFELQMRDGEALMALEQLAERKRDDKTVKRLVKKLINIGKYREAKKHCDLFPSKSNKALFKGICCLNLGEYEEAKDELTFAIEKKPEAFPYLMSALKHLGMDVALIRYGLLYENMGIESSLGEVLSRMLDAYIRIEDYRNGILTCDKMSKIPKIKDYALFKKGEIYYNLEDYVGAQESYKKLSEGNGPYSEDSFYYLLMIYRILNEENKFIEESSRFISSYPKSKYLEDVLFHLGEIEMMRSNFGEAVENYTKFLDLAKSPLRREGLIVHLVDILEESREQILAENMALKLGSASQRYFYLGRIKLSFGDEAQGVKFLRASLANGNLLAGVFLGDYFFEKNSLFNAKKYYSKARNKGLESDDHVEFQLALTYELMGKEHDAISILISLRNRTKDKLILSKIDKVLGKRSYAQEAA